MKKNLISNSIIFLLILFAITPILFALLGSFKELKDIINPIPKIIFSPTLENYITVLTTDSILRGIQNSTIIVGTSLLIGILVGIPAAYAIARYKPRGSNDLRFFLFINKIYAASSNSYSIYRYFFRFRLV